MLDQQNLLLPTDVSIPAGDTSTTSDENSHKGHDGSNLPRKPNSIYEPLNKLKTSVESSPNDLGKWDELFQALESKFTELYDPDQTDKPEHGTNIDPKFKAFVSRSYNQLLSRFPYLSEYWKKFSIIEYKLNGIQASINVLNSSVSQFSHSIDLWSDYLNALISQFELIKSEKERSEQLQLIRQRFEECLSLVGLHFNSDPLWDAYIQFETSINKKEETSQELLKVYLKLITIPLYQYAQYFNKFAEINKSFDIADLMSESEVADYVEKFQKASVDELSLIEKHQIIDDYSYAIFSKTQLAVNEKWNYESAITVSHFSLTSLDLVEKEVECWIKYLDYEIDNYKKTLKSGNEKDKQLQFEIVTQLFERALIPACFFSQLWMKYLAFLSIYDEDNDQKRNRIKSIYDRATTKFVPLDQSLIRFSYVEFLMTGDQFDVANEYLFLLIKQFSGTDRSLKKHMQKEYLECIRELLKLWSNSISREIFLRTLGETITTYFDKIDRYKSDRAKETDGDSNKTQFVLKNAHINVLQKLLNDQSICLLVSEYLELLKLYPSPSTAGTIRKFFTDHYRQPTLSKSTKFWKFMVEYEGLVQHNMINLTNITRYVKSHTALPKSVIDGLLDINYEILAANYTLMLRTSGGQPDDSLVLYDNDVSNSLTINKAARERLSRHNHLIQTTVEGKLPKPGSRPGHNSYQRSQSLALDREEELVNIARKHADHPGIFSDGIPEITNKIEDNWISLTDKEVKAPALPTFRNVEKASSTITYPSE